MRGLFGSSCPRSSRASTSCFVSAIKDVDGRNGGTHVVITDETRLMQGLLPVGGNSLTLNGLGYRCPPTKPR